MVGDGPVVAIVPARSGSKSIPDKNIRNFGGHPLIAWSIAAGLAASTVDRVVLSTDDEHIAQIGREYGAETPFLRPGNLARDETPDLPVFQHALEFLAEEEGYEPELVVQLRPTSPIRPPDLVDESVAKLRSEPQADSLRGVVPSGQNPYKMWRLEGERIVPLLEDPVEAYNLPRQALPQTFWQTGHIDVIRTQTIRAKNSMSGDFIIPALLDPAYTVDIDNLADWKRGEALLQSQDIDIVRPSGGERGLPDQIKLLVLDFDGVLTDNRVWVDRNGMELVAANRGDGWGLARLKESGVEVVVLSTESDPVVKARCDKLGIECFQDLDRKGEALANLLSKRGLDGSNVVFMGNDENDLPCLELVGYSVAPCDAHPMYRERVDRITTLPGGHGAVRELCDLIRAKLEASE